MTGWIRVCALDDIAPLGSRVVASSQGDIAIFRTAADQVFGLHDKCPHKGGPLSQGIVHGNAVTCRPCTMPCDSGPPLCGHLSCRAKTSSSLAVSYTHLTLPTNREG